MLEQRRILKQAAQQALRRLPAALVDRLRTSPRGSIPWRMGRLAVLDTVIRIPSGVARGLSFHVDEASSVYADGDYEIPVQEMIARQAEPGGVFFDIGANVGFFSLVAAAVVGTEGSVVAFEPEPTNATSVRRNFDLNGMTQAECLEVAVSDSPGLARLWVTEHPGGHTLASAGRPDDTLSDREVEVVTIDSLVLAGRVPAPTLVKIDVEGVELAVLAGMQETLARHHPSVICELDDADANRLVEKSARLRSFFESHGYRITPLPPAYEISGWNIAHFLAQPERETP